MIRDAKTGDENRKAEIRPAALVMLVTQHLLMRASQDAAKAYVRIGFQMVGHYRVLLLKSPIVVGATL